MTLYHTLWLSLRLIRKQRLRTVTLFCGILFSACLLITFCSFGYDFWMQVHGGSDETAEFDATQGILILLITILLLLILSCAVTLLHNLCSLTFARRWKSLSRLLALGADVPGLITMTLTETLALFLAAAPAGFLLSEIAIRQIGVQYPLPGWVIGAILLLLLLVSGLCNASPLQCALRTPKSSKPAKPFHSKPKIVHHKAESSGDRQKAGQECTGFLPFMVRKYRRASRGPYRRTTATILAAVLLYVPASYLINQNIAAQQSGLSEKYGIQYNCHPISKTELEFALEEYRQLAVQCPEEEAMLSVTFYTTASVQTEGISSELRRALKRAGWQESPTLFMDGAILFLEDPAYAAFAKNSNAKGSKANTSNDNTSNDDASAILINRCINRSSWQEDSDLIFSETPLLGQDADLSGVELYTDFTESFEPVEAGVISPDHLTGQIPEGIDFTGDLTLILPLSRLEQFCDSSFAYDRLSLQGKFTDSKEDTFSRLKDCLGEHSLGQLTYSRKVLLEWYDSMQGIHQAMNAICATLFFIAVLNIFSTMIFQSMERKRGLSILWSLGQTTKGLLKIMILESVAQLLTAMIFSIPLSCILCYYIYRIFRQAWLVPFVLPLGQLLLILAAAALVSLAAMGISRALMKGQDFLANIRELT